MVFSAVNLECDRKFRDFLGSGRALGRLSDTLCVENGLSIIEKPQHTTLTYDKWLGDRATQSQREEMRATIDEIMRQKPESFDTLLSVLREKGWEIKHGKRMSARAPGQVRFKRLDSLGEEYSEKTLRAALDERREWKPKERRKGQKSKIEHTSVTPPTSRCTKGYRCALLAAVGAANYTTQYAYFDPDPEDTILTTPLVTSITQNGQNFSYTYDNVGNITSVTRNGLTTTYEYDSLGQLTRDKAAFICCHEYDIRTDCRYGTCIHSECIKVDSCS